MKETVQLTPHNNRESGFELIRIVAMSMIIIHHFLCHVIKHDLAMSDFYRVVDPFFLCGVNLFFLISGWFSIKFSFKRFIEFILLILFFDMLNYAACVLCGLPVDLKKLFIYLIFPVSRSGYWFIEVYVFIMIFSPILNIGLKNIEIKYLRIIVGLLIFGLIYSCDLGVNFSNRSGLSFMQGISLYVVGFYLHRDAEIFNKIRTSYLIGLYFAIITLYSLLNYILPPSFYLNLLGQYNSVFIIGAAVSLFLGLGRLKFQSNLVNRLGAASLGCYLLQDGAFGFEILYKWCYNFYLTSESRFDVFLLFASLFIIFWIISLIVTPLFKALAKICVEYLKLPPPQHI